MADGDPLVAKTRNNCMCMGSRLSIHDSHLEYLWLTVLVFLTVSIASISTDVFALNSKPTVSEDSNLDGRIDQMAWFDKDQHLKQIEVDSNGDGHIDLRKTFDGGKHLKTEWDSNHNKVFDIRELYTQDRCVARQSLDEGSGKIIQEIRFDSAGRPVLINEYDIPSGLPYRIQHYVDGSLHHIEVDQNHDGRFEQFTTYKNDKAITSQWDDDGDGTTERILHFDSGGRPFKEERGLTQTGHYSTTLLYIDGEIVESIFDADGDELFEERCEYHHGLVRIREIDSNSDGHIDIRKTYSPNATLIEESHFQPDSSLPTHIYRFDSEGRLSRQIQDLNTDDIFEITIEYVNGQLVLIKEDTDANGKADVLEVYDHSGVLQKRSRDLDEDGEPDIDIFIRKTS